MTVEGHEQLLAVARTMTGMVMISGYDTEVYNDMLTGCKNVENLTYQRRARYKSTYRMLWRIRQYSRNRRMQHERRSGGEVMDKCGFWKDIWSLLQGGDNKSPALSLKSGEADISSV
jgi:hypothetical protein